MARCGNAVRITAADIPRLQTSVPVLHIRNTCNGDSRAGVLKRMGQQNSVVCIDDGAMLGNNTLRLYHLHRTKHLDSVFDRNSYASAHHHVVFLQERLRARTR